MSLTTGGASVRPDSEVLLAAATALAESDLRMRAELVKARRSAGLTQRQVAEVLGIKQASVAAFEHYDNDPRLSTLRRYALAVGAHVDHTVTAHGWAEWSRPSAPVSAVRVRPAARTTSLPGPGLTKADLALAA